MTDHPDTSADITTEPTPLELLTNDELGALRDMNAARPGEDGRHRPMIRRWLEGACMAEALRRQGVDHPPPPLWTHDLSESIRLFNDAEIADALSIVAVEVAAAKKWKLAGVVTALESLDAAVRLSAVARLQIAHDAAIERAAACPD
ncbi:MAG: hypothetical protein ACF8PN_06760 [Phycisphaerales bacterium]